MPRARIPYRFPKNRAKRAGRDSQAGWVVFRAAKWGMLGWSGWSGVGTTTTSGASFLGRTVRDKPSGLADFGTDTPRWAETRRRVGGGWQMEDLILEP